MAEIMSNMPMMGCGSVQSQAGGSISSAEKWPQSQSKSVPLRSRQSSMNRRSGRFVLFFM